MADKIDAYSLASRGVVVDKSDVHTQDAELLHAQNWQVDAVGGRGSIRRRDGFLALNATPLAGPVLGGIGVPLEDSTGLTRTFYLALNDGIRSFKISTDGTTWTDVTVPGLPVREATLGIDTGQLYGDAAMLWQGVGDTLYFPGNDYLQGGPTLPTLHAWNGTEDVIAATIPANPLDLGSTLGAFGITSLVPYSDSQQLIVVADRTSGQGRMRVLLHDMHDGSLTQLGASVVLTKGRVLSGIVVWQRKVWIAGVNISTGSPLLTYWIQPGDPEWTQDDSYATQHGFCTGLAVFKGELYQGNAAEAGVNAEIRKRAQGAAGGTTALTTVSGGGTAVPGGSATVVARPAPTTLTLTPLFPGGGIPDEYGTWGFEYAFLYSDGQESLPSPSGTAANSYHGDLSNNDLMRVTFGLGDARVVDRVLYKSKPSGGGFRRGSFLAGTPGGGSTGAVYVGDNTTTVANFGYFSSGTFTNVPTAAAGYVAGCTYLYVDDCAKFFAGGGSVVVGGQTFTYTGRSVSSGVGALTGVSGVTSTIAVGAGISALIPAGATSLPVAETSAVTASGNAIVAGQTIAYTGRSVGSGAGNLTGVTGLITAVVGGSSVTQATIAIGATVLPIADTTYATPAGGAATVAGQALTYTGRSTISGPGNLTGVSGITPAIAYGASVSLPVGAVSLWTLVYTSAGTAAGNSVGPFIVSQDGGTIFAFLNRAGAGSFELQIIKSQDGALWAIDYDVKANVGATYTKSGMPVLDDNGDIYWPLASGSSGSGSGGLMKRTRAGAWSVVLSGLTNIRGPLGILRT